MDKPNDNTQTQIRKGKCVRQVDFGSLVHKKVELEKRRRKIHTEIPQIHLISPTFEV